jgi:hypothetical protein
VDSLVTSTLGTAESEEIGLQSIELPTLTEPQTLTKLPTLTKPLNYRQSTKQDLNVSSANSSKYDYQKAFDQDERLCQHRDPQPWRKGRQEEETAIGVCYCSCIRFLNVFFIEYKNSSKHKGSVRF